MIILIFLILAFVNNIYTLNPQAFLKHKPDVDFLLGLTKSEESNKLLSIQ